MEYVGGRYAEESCQQGWGDPPVLSPWAQSRHHCGKSRLIFFNSQRVLKKRYAGVGELILTEVRHKVSPVNGTDDHLEGDHEVGA